MIFGRENWAAKAAAMESMKAEKKEKPAPPSEQTTERPQTLFEKMRGWKKVLRAVAFVSLLSISTKIMADTAEQAGGGEAKKILKSTEKPSKLALSATFETKKTGGNIDSTEPPPPEPEPDVEHKAISGFQEGGGGAEILKDISEKGFSVGVLVNPRMGETKEMAGKLAGGFDRESLEKMPEGTPIMTDSIYGIGLARKLAEYPEDHEDELKRDKYGNIIEHIIEVEMDIDNGKENITEYVKIFPPTPFAEEDATSDELRGVRVDWKSAGIDVDGEDGDVFLQKALEVNMRLGDYKVHFSYEGAPVEELEGKLKAVAEGIDNAKKFFGVSGRSIERIFVIDTQETNAAFKTHNPNTLIFTDEVLRNMAPEQLSHFAFHEFSHKMDVDTSLRDHYQIVEVFDNLPPEFFEAINESKWFADVEEKSFGGHSQENVAELIASFLSTSQHPDFAEKFNALDGTQKDQFRKVASAFLDGLKESLGEEENAESHPVIAWLENIKGSSPSGTALASR